MEKQMQRVILGPALVLVFAASCFGVPTFSGSLTGDGGGITATDGWDDAATTFSWEVTDNSDGTWTYNYVFDIPRKDISHLIIEVSDSFTLENYLSGPTPDLQTYSSTTQGSSNPGMPDLLYGLKFEAPDETGTFEIEFVSDRAPVWGDFYSKDGKDQQGTIDVFAFNTGFGDPDSDPNDPPANGSVGFHILVPDTFTEPPNGGPVIPAPAAALLSTLGAGFVNILRRRRWL